MRIVYLNPVGEIGGGERSLLQLLVEIGRTEPTLERRLILGADGPLRAEAEKIGVATEIVPFPASIAGFGDSGFRELGTWPRRLLLPFQMLMSLPGILLYLIRLRRHLRAIEPTIIHSNGIKMHVVGALARPRRARLIWHIRDFLSERPLVGRLLRTLRRRATHAVANSHATRNDAATILAPLKVVTIHNAIDVERFRPAAGNAAALDRLAGFPATSAGAVRVGLIATYARWKGHSLFLEAAAEVVRRSPTLPIYFYIVGGPIYHTPGSQTSAAELTELAAKLGVSDRVGLVPYQADAVPVYQALDVVVHASTRREPFGLTIVEAMACGRATIVAAAGGAAEIVEDQVNALAVKMGDIEELAAAIQALAADEEQRERLGAEGRRTVVERFASSRLGAQFAELYLDLAGNGDR